MHCLSVFGKKKRFDDTLNPIIKHNFSRGMSLFTDSSSCQIRKWYHWMVLSRWKLGSSLQAEVARYRYLGFWKPLSKFDMLIIMSWLGVMKQLKLIRLQILQWMQPEYHCIYQSHSLVFWSTPCSRHHELHLSTLSRRSSSKDGFPWRIHSTNFLFIGIKL